MSDYDIVQSNIIDVPLPDALRYIRDTPEVTMQYFMNSYHVMFQGQVVVEGNLFNSEQSINLLLEMAGLSKPK